MLSVYGQERHVDSLWSRYRLSILDSLSYLTQANASNSTLRWEAKTYSDVKLSR